MWLRRVSLSSVLLLALGSAIALAKPKPQFPQTMVQNFGEQGREAQGPLKLMARLNLSSAQQQELQTIYSQYKDQISQRKQAVRQANRELRDLMVSTASNDEIRAKYQEVQALRQQLEAARFESLLAMRDVLTPAQRSRFAQLMEQQGKFSYTYNR
jgi:Spy/CpxP family protein refolding chaperone